MIMRMVMTDNFNTDEFIEHVSYVVNKFQDKKKAGTAL